MAADAELRARFGKLLRAERKRAGLTQTELGQLVDHTQQAIANYEAGRRMPDQVTMVALSQALGRRPGYLGRALFEPVTPVKAEVVLPAHTHTAGGHGQASTRLDLEADVEAQFERYDSYIRGRPLRTPAFHLTDYGGDFFNLTALKRQRPSE